MEELGSRIRRARQTRRVTAAQLAEHIGVSANYISELERGVKKNPSMQVIAKMSDVLDFPVDYFFGVEQRRIAQYIPEDLSSYVHEAIVQSYGETTRDLEELDDREVMDALMEYVREMRKKTVE
ncbi:helix-turn-helix transcriptional regulator [Tumebacillus sp. DT12]|uniref:Helix-turn-helix transcriptional regulator n=1 Tax=Tumebacillus lacus TaxID=2995335 RepID=A0ABT3X3L5_9BACL|nr:helix-turn-helix transcriptional regulator [Tumebacillus lacus]MCX7571486.1 helix-turn-helix transcriptional regulator [Tumebacillus lacus]